MVQDSQISRFILWLAAWLLKRLPKSRRFELVATEELAWLQMTADRWHRLQASPAAVPTFRVLADMDADTRVALYEGDIGAEAHTAYAAAVASGVAQSVVFMHRTDRLQLWSHADG